jgi:hypothetical protein
MTAKRIFLLFTVLALISTGSFMILRTNEPSAAELFKAEQEVYSFLLSEQRQAYSTNTDKFQILEYTNSGEFQGGSVENSAGIHLNTGIEPFPDLKPQVWADFQEKNKISYPMKDYLPPTEDVILVNLANSEQLYWWISFSRIGFNSSLNQALVLLGDCRGESCYDNTISSIYSQGFYIFLQKKSGEWTIQDRQYSWFIEAPAP